MDPILFNPGSPAVAGLWFVVGFVVGLFAAAKYGKATLCLSVIIGLLCCAIRGYSEPLGFVAVASVSVVHVACGCISVLIVKNVKPAKFGGSGK